MQLTVSRGPNITILNGQVNSNEMIFEETVGDSDSVSFYSSLTTFGIQVNYAYNTGDLGDTWITVAGNTGTAIAVAAPGKSTAVQTSLFIGARWRLVAGSAVGADTVVLTMKQAYI